jgi:ATP-binding cassette subfamily B protein
LSAAGTVELRDIPAWRGPLGPNTLRVFGYLRPERRLLVGIGCLTLLSIPCALLEPYVLHFLVDRIIVPGRVELLPRFMLGIAPFLIAATSLDFLLSYALLRLARNLHGQIKSVQLDNLLGKSANFFRNTPSGKILFSFFNDSNQIGSLLSVGLVGALLQLVFAGVRIGIVIWISPLLGLLYVLAVLPLQTWLTHRVTRIAARLEIELKRTDEELTHRLESLLRGALVVKSLGFGAPLAGIWKQRFASRMDLDLRNMVWRQLGTLGVANLQTAGSFAVLGLGVYRIAAGSLSLGELLAFLALAGRIGPSLQALVGFAIGAQEILVNVERYYRIHDLPGEELELSRGRVRGAAELSERDLDEIRCRDVRVDHGNGSAVAIPCDFAMRAGELVAWHGENGTGKTSLALGLAGLVPHAPGSILCRGRPLSDFTPASIRRQVVYVGCEPFWPERSLAANFAEAGALDEARLAHALEASTAAPIVASLPRGMQTVLRDDGHVLSRGENQRLFLALALYRAPRVLILDEALGNVSEPQLRRILAGLAALPRRPLVVYVSHRPDLEGAFARRIGFGARV